MGAKAESRVYHEGHRGLQDEFDTRRLADRIEQLLVSDTIDGGLKGFIETRDSFFLATCDKEGRPNCSYKGGDPGFVRVPDKHTVAWPNYDGNGMYLSMGNLAVNPAVGVLFIDFEEGNRVRVNGDASIHRKDPLLKEFPEAQFMVRVKVREVFPNCPRYIHRYTKEEASPFVPRAGCETPVPGWKTARWSKDALPAKDPARDPKRTVI
jgi:predicted pyridoxine 5'-phosphate oxidase superfamily flavin-nucleotide-binding protein